MGAGRRLALGQDADALARDTVGPLLLQHRIAGIAAFLAPALADRPGQPGFDRRRALGDVAAIEAEPGLQP